MSKKETILSFSFPAQMKSKLQKNARGKCGTLSWYIKNIFEIELKRIITERRK